MILITGKIPHVDNLIEWLASQVSETVIYEPSLDEACAKHAHADIMIGLQASKFTDKHLQYFPDLAWYHTLSSGVNALPLKAFQRRGVTLTNSRGIHGIPMSEHIIGMMLMFSRNLCAYVRNQLEQEWSGDYPRLGELYGKTLCVVGAGSIGRAVAQRARAFGMQTIGVKRTEEPLAEFDVVVGSSRLHEVLPQADYVVVLTPLTDETFHFFGSQQFAKMKQTAIFLNFARGPVVDEHALVTVLEDNRIGGAGLDVFENEPLPANNPLWRLENVVLTPHVAGISGRYNDRAFEKFVENYDAWQKGEPLPTEVNLELGY